MKLPRRQFLQPTSRRSDGAVYSINPRSANGGNGCYWLKRDHPAGLLTYAFEGKSGPDMLRSSSSLRDPNSDMELPINLWQWC
jgi:hypothetical protein